MADKTAAADKVDTSTNGDEDDSANLEDFGDEGFESGEEVPDKTLDSKGKVVPASTDDEDESSDDSEDDESESDDKTEEESTQDDESDQDKSTEEDDAEESTDSADDKSDEKTSLSADEQKRHNDEMARNRIAERTAKDKAVKAQKDADEATIERYLREAGDDDMELEKRKLNVEAFRLGQDRKSVNEEKLQTGLEKAVANIPLFQTGDKAALDELYAAADDFERMYVKKDKDGRPIEILGDINQFLQSKAKSIQKLQASGARQQDKDKSRQKSKTTALPVKAPAKKKSDEGIDAFDEEAKRP